MKLFLTKDFNESFLNDKDLSCLIDSYILVSDKNDYIKNAHDTETISDLTFDDVYKKTDVWKFLDLIKNKIIHEPALEYTTTENGYSFYSWPIKIDVGSDIVKNNKSKKLRCIGLIHTNGNNDVLVGILYFDETTEGITLNDNAKEINILLSFDEKELDENSRIVLTESILENSFNETTDLVRYSSNDTLKLKVTDNKNDKENCYALAVMQNENPVFNPSGASLVITKKNDASAKPFLSLSDFNNSVIIDNDNDKFKAFVLNEDNVNYSIFSKSITPATNSIDIFVNDAFHYGDDSDFVLNSNSISSTITGYENAEGNLIINGSNETIYGDDSTFINVHNLSGKETEFGLGNSILLNSNDCYYDNDGARSEMILNAIGTLNASSYNKSEYEWERFNNSVNMIGSNISSVNINGNNATFFGFSGLVPNQQTDGYIIGSFNDPFDDALMTISTGWFNETYKPKVFKLEEHFVYETNKSWISRNNLMTIYDNKDIYYTYYDEGVLTGNTIENATCIKLGNTFFTPNEIISDEKKMDLGDIIDMKYIDGDVNEGNKPLTDDVRAEIENLTNSINAFSIIMTKDDFDGSNTKMSIEKFKSLLQERAGITFNANTVYLIYVLFLGNPNNKRYIVDINNDEKLIQNGEAVTCTKLNIFNNAIANL